MGGKKTRQNSEFRPVPALLLSDHFL